MNTAINNLMSELKRTVTMNVTAPVELTTELLGLGNDITSDIIVTATMTTKLVRTISPTLKGFFTGAINDSDLLSAFRETMALTSEERIAKQKELGLKAWNEMTSIVKSATAEEAK